MYSDHGAKPILDALPCHPVTRHTRAPLCSALPNASAPRWCARLGIALAVGVVYGGYCWASLRVTGQLGRDFTWPWRAAQLVLRGMNPYDAIRATGAYPFDARFKYPLTSVLIALPVVRFAPEAAAALLVGVSTAAFAWFLTRDGYGRWPLLLSGPLFSAVRSAQFTPLLAAALLASPSAVGLGVIKPNMGVAMLAARPSWRAVCVGGALVAISVAVQPTWPVAWWTVLRTSVESYYRAPLIANGYESFAILSPLALIAAIGWRNPDSRLLLALICCPQTGVMYDALLATTVAKTTRDALALSLPSLFAAAWTAGIAPTNPLAARVAALFVYVPALLLVIVRGGVSAPASVAPRSCRMD